MVSAKGSSDVDEASSIIYEKIKQTKIQQISYIHKQTHNTTQNTYKTTKNY
jgi:hypothetical protein